MARRGFQRILRRLGWPLRHPARSLEYLQAWALAALVLVFAVQLAGERAFGGGLFWATVPLACLAVLHAFGWVMAREVPRLRPWPLLLLLPAFWLLLQPLFTGEAGSVQRLAAAEWVLAAGCVWVLVNGFRNLRRFHLLLGLVGCVLTLALAVFWLAEAREARWSWLLDALHADPQAGTAGGWFLRRESLLVLLLGLLPWASTATAVRLFQGHWRILWGFVALVFAVGILQQELLWASVLLVLQLLLLGVVWWDRGERLRRHLMVFGLFVVLLGGLYVAYQLLVTDHLGDTAAPSQTALVLPAPDSPAGWLLGEGAGLLRQATVLSSPLVGPEAVVPGTGGAWRVALQSYGAIGLVSVVLPLLVLWVRSLLRWRRLPHLDVPEEVAHRAKVAELPLHHYLRRQGIGRQPPLHPHKALGGAALCSLLFLMLGLWFDPGALNPLLLLFGALNAGLLIRTLPVRLSWQAPRGWPVALTAVLLPLLASLYFHLAYTASATQREVYAGRAALETLLAAPERAFDEERLAFEPRDIFARATAVHPGHASAWALLGWAQWMGHATGRQSEAAHAAQALPALDAARTLAPLHWQAELLYARLLGRTGAAWSAVEASLQAALDRAPPLAFIWIEAAELHLRYSTDQAPVAALLERARALGASEAELQALERRAALLRR